MIGQQRQILTDLGIDLWIPRDVACQNLTAPSIWRDQAIEPLHQWAVIDSEPQVEIPSSAIEQPKPVPQSKHQPQPEPEADVKLLEPHTTELTHEAVQSIPEQNNTAHDLGSFELQLLELAQCAIVIDASQLSTAAQQLWANINQALQAQYQQLNWPFPLLNLQDSNGAHSYLEGFLDAHSVDRPLISLGDLPYLHPKALRLPSLDDMLAKPMLKKQLWQLIQNNKQG